jgi:hypothetical protein
MIRVGAVLSNPQGACSYYRSVGPFSKIKEVSFEFLEKGNWVNYSSLDVLYLERPVMPSFIEGIRMAKSFNIPVWVDFDDDLFDVPKYNPAYGFYSKDETKQSVIAAVSMADVITVTTPTLQKVFQKYNKNVIIIPNAWNNYNFPLQENFSNKKIINWRGSATHRNDLLEYKDALLASAEARKDWKWSFIGKEHWMISDFIDDNQKMTFDEMDIIQYFNLMVNLNPGIQIVPLKINEFNKSKSNIAWLEGTAAGAVTLAPIMEQWERPGIVNFSSLDDLKEKITELQTNEKYRRAMYKASKNYIEENLLLNNVNKKRIEILNQLIF